MKIQLPVGVQVAHIHYHENIFIYCIFFVLNVIPFLLLIFFLSWFILILEKVRIPLVIGTHPPLCTTLTGTTFSASLNNHTTGVYHIQGGE